MASVLAELRAATAAVHRDAERHRFVRDLFGPSPSRLVYARYLAGLVEVYGALEAALAARRDDVGLLADPRLARRDRVAEDLAALGTDAAPPASAAAYVARIREVTPALPRLAAHAYVRYLGDLAGGQELGARVQAAFGAGGRDVSRAYRFEGFDDLAQASAGVRAELARIAEGDAARAAMTDEAVRAFDATVALFTELTEPGRPV